MVWGMECGKKAQEASMGSVGGVIVSKKMIFSCFKYSVISNDLFEVMQSLVLDLKA